MDHGILYVATGKRYRLEANISASSVGKVMPTMHITVYTDSKDNLDVNLFNNIEIIDQPTYSFYDKINPLCKSPYKKTLFLDTDTFVLDEIYELFDVLDKFELTYCHAPGRGADNPKFLAECPLAFTEPNTGVMSYVATDRVAQLFHNWSVYYQSLLNETPRRITHDQPAFRKVLYNSDIYSLVLPPEYNLRTPYPFFKGRMPAKILHGREPSLSKVVEAMRKDENNNWGVYDFRVKRNL